MSEPQTSELRAEKLPVVSTESNATAHMLMMQHRYGLVVRDSDIAETMRGLADKIVGALNTSMD